MAPISALAGGLTQTAVIVIVALDESGDEMTRQHILPILALDILDLPPNFRILVTSQPLPDIFKAFGASTYRAGAGPPLPCVIGDSAEITWHEQILNGLLPPHSIPVVAKGPHWSSLRRNDYDHSHLFSPTSLLIISFLILSHLVTTRLPSSYEGFRSNTYTKLCSSW